MLALQLAIHAERRPAQTAVIYGQRRLSHAQLHERSSRFAQALAAQAAPGTVVADPVLMLYVRSGRVQFPVTVSELQGTANWAKPIVMAARQLAPSKRKGSKVVRTVPRSMRWGCCIA